jgi:hypothetical protein
MLLGRLKTGTDLMVHALICIDIYHIYYFMVFQFITQ